MVRTLDLIVDSAGPSQEELWVLHEELGACKCWKPED